MAVKSKALASVPDIDFGNYFDSWYQTSSAEAIRRSQGWAIPLQGTRQGITLWFWFLGVVFLSGRLAFLFPHLRKKILSGSLCGFFFFNFEREQCFLLNSCGWIAPKFHPPPNQCTAAFHICTCGSEARKHLCVCPVSIHEALWMEHV